MTAGNALLAVEETQRIAFEAGAAILADESSLSI
jgi:hypothetical protein